ncbi:antitoxin protein of toxin-antitoxin system [Actinocorallia herbida]|uniref:Antitoxin protein of toxin-antitoxin system n=1 Tax=Actinocorallia herbida TaxID=58109 RepID=A0A3N1CQL8_9ACTN|nr:antitoxin [Actinocorallia herbida]ROO83606.1 antitoxin protein of toxin-antitoxin system [Actinocorallia herbida]
MSIVQKVMDMLGKHADKADSTIDKTGDMIDKKTGNKYKSQIDSAQQKAKETARQIADKQRRSR